MRLAIAVLAVAAAPTPAQLLQKIAVSPWPVADLPAHVTIKQIGSIPISTQGKKYHAAGEIGFILKGPDPNDEIVFEVFPTAADAVGDIRHPHLNAGDVTHGRVPGVPDSLRLTTSATQNGAKVGISIAAAVHGNVIVQAVTTSKTSAKHGNDAMVRALLKAGLAHLKKLGGLSA
jgi:hypothetical protein